MSDYRTQGYTWRNTLAVEIVSMLRYEARCGDPTAPPVSDRDRDWAEHAVRQPTHVSRRILDARTSITIIYICATRLIAYIPNETHTTRVIRVRYHILSVRAETHHTLNTPRHTRTHNAHTAGITHTQLGSHTTIIHITKTSVSEAHAHTFIVPKRSSPAWSRRCPASRRA